jgi:hypothetical protein
MTAPQMTVTQNAKTMVVTASTQMGEIKTNHNPDGTEARSLLDQRAVVRSRDEDRRDGAS